MCSNPLTADLLRNLLRNAEAAVEQAKKETQEFGLTREQLKNAKMVLKIKKEELKNIKEIITKKK